MKILKESKETNKLYKAIANTADAIDDLADDDKNSARNNLNSAETNIEEVKDELKESEELDKVDTGASALLNDLIQREYELLNQYDSVQVTLESHNEKRFSEIFDYIADDINIHIGMLQACLEDLDPSAEKVEDGKEQADELMLDETMFDEEEPEELNENGLIMTPQEATKQYAKQTLSCYPDTAFVSTLI